ncbi:hypothetical protein BL250_07735 [Erwinia sp. OLTSP20]|uniref:DUF1198 family protein n=1 Tax=unclassified Erwinia TaxID=2622719 RepID=UPI000C182BE5|nr:MULTISPECIES: DUF1198 family protein [unclassified Erwinia]PIJ50643.1 hypothetical protein BV501_07740 [Erwinia sp. OAMSP11]PIJ72689.1 hypothetical protein BK416_08610 [Erwinia sp. OLSSP12]PIJ83229.1 hypothetical protein BLD47_05150 [Erwinia sp. OLCASP19]PIJ85270.1 hypothetical protein BLD46_06580 [Erwinia sp. OLMTSP26]PIJ87272.1 hypothetical protein BLD49_06595 [Erwinia sp. OLMDSP33]
MIWLMLATLIVVFIAGFRLLTATTRHSARALSKRLNIAPVQVESLLLVMGRDAAQEFTDYIARDDEETLRNAAVVLLIWQVFIVDNSEENQLRWRYILRKAAISADISRQQMLLALGFLRQLEPDSREMNVFRQAYNAHFMPDPVDSMPTEERLISLDDHRHGRR